MNFHEYILKLRQERGLKQSDVALSIGVTVRAYQAYEYGKSEPRMSTLIALADFYDLSLDASVIGLPKGRTRCVTPNLRKNSACKLEFAGKKRFCPL